LEIDALETALPFKRQEEEKNGRLAW
jgi:hypothetical protein